MFFVTIFIINILKFDIFYACGIFVGADGHGFVARLNEENSESLSISISHEIKTVDYILVSDL